METTSSLDCKKWQCIVYALDLRDTAASSNIPISYKNEKGLTASLLAMMEKSRIKGLTGSDSTYHSPTFLQNETENLTPQCFQQRSCT